jgi:putative FmdB family regulatory protein
VIFEEPVVPTYAYACTECGHRFDAVQAFSDNALTECPQCAGKLRKLFSAVGIVFKGSGFYRTDSRKAATAVEGSGGSSSGSSDGSGGSGGEKKKEPASSGSSSDSGSKPNPSSSTTGTTSQVKAAS